jgi:hypothetical protein
MRIKKITPQTDIPTPPCASYMREFDAIISPSYRACKFGGSGKNRNIALFDLPTRKSVEKLYLWYSKISI